ncbi:hypothetical protein [Syntrophorhabdus aromaticivorans]|uniref:hypothetical protein n=1 Tax=Syntrophorhabdus aromaticivorans TaxID=328301 RepID=UPI0004172B2C|nr:hypothetical protein [Syntrophorhabdus aromaticivorans]
MALLKALQTIVTKKGVTIPPGAVVKAKNPDRLIASGQARRLTKKERQGIVRAYFDFAKRVFG